MFGPKKTVLPNETTTLAHKQRNLNRITLNFRIDIFIKPPQQYLIQQRFDIGLYQIRGKSSNEYSMWIWNCGWRKNAETAVTVHM